jgi:hypothetical protein
VRGAGTWQISLRALGGLCGSLVAQRGTGLETNAPALARLALASNWKGSFGFDVFQRETRCNVLERNCFDQTLVKNIEGRGIGHNDTQAVIDVARHAIALHDFFHRGDFGGEASIALSE